MSSELVENQEEEPVEEVGGETAKSVQKALKKGKRKDSVEIEGVEVSEPAEALANLELAIKAVSKVLPFKKTDLFFKKFEGNTVGRATGESRVEVDPVMLMHPMHRLAHVIMHEVSHKGANIQNEGLVEAYAAAMMKKTGLAEDEDGGLNATEKYDKALKNFYDFVKVVGKGRPEDEVVAEVYKLYYADQYEAIYEMYEKNHMSKLPTDDQQDKAYDFFQSAFPELQVSNDGWYKSMELEEDEVSEEEAEPESAEDSEIEAPDESEDQVA